MTSTLQLVQPPPAQHFDDYLTYIKAEQCSPSPAASGAGSPPRNNEDAQPAPGPLVLTTKKACRERAQHEAPTVCTICGAPTDCLHYDVASCNACKAFFRRSVLKKRRYECKGVRHCDIASGSRCRACRFDKCLRRGMNVKAINLPADLAADDLHAFLLQRAQPSCPPQRHARVQTQFLPRFEQTDEARTVGFLSYLENRWNRLRVSKYNPKELYNVSIDYVLAAPCEIANADRYEVPARWPPVDLRPGIALHPDAKLWHFCDLIVCIEYFKAMPFFALLDHDDKKHLVSSVAFVSSLFIQAYYSYARNMDTIIHPDGLLPAQLITNLAHRDRCPEMQRIFQAELKFVRETLEPLARVGPTEDDYLLLKGIMCCHSAAPNLSEFGRTLLEKERRAFSHALLHRLQARLGAAAGAQRYADMVTMIGTFIHVARNLRDFHVYRQAIRPRPEPALFEYLMRT